MTRFTGRDIGAELLPILTSGLYREPFDAIREYAQNGIDAGASEIKVIVASDSVLVHDNGSGMSEDVAKRAIRLGISEKDPRSQVGFRGIGIYSSLHLCDQLIIRTRDTEGTCSRIDMKFATIRAQLEEQEEGRLRGEKPTLWLEGVLSQTVTVDPDPHSPLEEPGTMVLLLGLSTDLGDRLRDQEALEAYLEDVIPLPLNSAFLWAEFITEKLGARGYKPVKVDLTHDGISKSLYRPYNNDMYAEKNGQKPEFFEVNLPDSRKRLGYGWYSLNDVGEAFKDESVRGIIVKKFGFSVGDRSYMKDLYGKQTVGSRVTGEIIVEDPELLPNAARSDFEAGLARDRFRRALLGIASRVNSDANKLAQRWRAEDVLNAARSDLDEVLAAVPTATEDTERLLELNARMSLWEQKLKLHRRPMPEHAKANLDSYDASVKKIRSQLTKLIETKRRKRLSQTANLVKELGEVQGQLETEEPVPSKPPSDLLDIADRLGLSITPIMHSFLVMIDTVLLKPNLPGERYSLALSELLEQMEDQP